MNNSYTHSVSFQEAASFVSSGSFPPFSQSNANLNWDEFDKANYKRSLSCMYGCEHFVSSFTEPVSNLQQPQLDLGGLTHRGQLLHVGHLIRLFSSGGKKKKNSGVLGSFAFLWCVGCSHQSSPPLTFCPRPRRPHCPWLERLQTRPLRLSWLSCHFCSHCCPSE